MGVGNTSVLKYHSYTQKSQGFTIVELLIVIVVIGILAAITIVAYNGIQMRAENTKTIQGVGQYVKAIHSYAALKGNYPIEAGFPCLGPMGTTCARMSGTNTCTASGGDGGASAQTTFDTEMKEVISGSMPTISGQRMNCAGNMYAGGYYRPSTGTTASIIYYLRGDQSCSGIGGVQSFTKTQQDDITRCLATLTPLT